MPRETPSMEMEEGERATLLSVDSGAVGLADTRRGRSTRAQLLLSLMLGLTLGVIAARIGGRAADAALGGLSSLDAKHDGVASAPGAAAVSTIASLTGALGDVADGLTAEDTQMTSLVNQLQEKNVEVETLILALEAKEGVGGTATADDDKYDNDDDASHPVPSPTIAPTIHSDCWVYTCPTSTPSAKPTLTPSRKPTDSPVPDPTSKPTRRPTDGPSHSPTYKPTNKPTTGPSEQPTLAPTSSAPSFHPSAEPSQEPTAHPSYSPSFSPSAVPSPVPSPVPTTPGPSSTPTLAPSTFGHLTCGLYGLDHADALWCDTFCGDDPGVEFYTDNGYGDWIFEMGACYLKQADQTQKDSTTWFGADYRDSLSWHDYYLQVTVSTHNKFSFADVTAADDMDDAVQEPWAAHPSVYVRAFPEDTGEEVLGGGYQVGLRVWENAISMYGDGCDGVFHKTHIDRSVLNMTTGQDYLLGISLNGDQMKVYIDDVQHANFTMGEDTCTTGGVGFHTRYADATFRNLTISNTSSTPLTSDGYTAKSSYHNGHETGAAALAAAKLSRSH